MECWRGAVWWGAERVDWEEVREGMARLGRQVAEGNQLLRTAGRIIDADIKTTKIVIATCSTYMTFSPPRRHVVGLAHVHFFARNAGMFSQLHWAHGFV